MGQTGRQQVESLYTRRIYAENIFKTYEESIRDYSKVKRKRVKPPRKLAFTQDEIRA
jgi:hypothetical protein